MDHINFFFNLLHNQLFFTVLKKPNNLEVSNLATFFSIEKKQNLTARGKILPGIPNLQWNPVTETICFCKFVISFERVLNVWFVIAHSAYTKAKYSWKRTSAT